MNKHLTKQELLALLERIYTTEPYFFDKHLITAEIFATFLQAEQIHVWESTVLPVRDAPVWMKERLVELPLKKGQRVNGCLLYARMSSEHELVDSTKCVIMDIGMELDRMVLNMWNRENLKQTDLIQLLLVLADNQTAPRTSAGSVDASFSSCSATLKDNETKLPFILGRAENGQIIEGDMRQLHNLLIAGRANTDISGCINVLLGSLLYQADPRKVQLILVDSLEGGLSTCDGIPHLYLPVITDMSAAVSALQEVVAEIKQRRHAFSMVGVENWEAYNDLADRTDGVTKLPAILVVVDDLAELMKAAPKEVESFICQIAGMGHFVGIHLVVTTRCVAPDVITGYMKFYIPSRIAFTVDSAMESRIILDNKGANQLTGRDEMLYSPLWTSNPICVHGCGISNDEMAAVMDIIKKRDWHICKD